VVGWLAGSLVGSLAGSLADSSVLCLAIVWMIGWSDR
jgi:hypothetical protein